MGGARDHYDLIVIGAGPAGEKAAAQAAYYGKSVAIIDRGERPGGAVVNAGVVPSKTLRETALYLSGFGARDVYGVGMSLTPAHALDRLKARAAEVTDQMAAVVLENIARHGVDLIHGEARLEPGRVVAVEAAAAARRALRADVVLIATGSRPFHPPGMDFGDPDVHDSDSIVSLDRIPATMAVIGGGPVACEYASLFTALGVRVVLVDAGPRLLSFADEDISATLARSFVAMGMEVVVGGGRATVTRARDGLEVRLEGGRSLVVEKVLFAAGRAGSTAGLGLEAAGVACGERGHILVDDTYRTSAEGIYAAGDVIGPPALASVSAEQGRVAACHAFGIDFKRYVDPHPPVGVYAIPEVGMVGMTSEHAFTAGFDAETGVARFDRNARAQISGDTQGMLKLVFDARDRKLLGVHIVGSDATELVHHGQGVLNVRGTIDWFIHATYNTPTRTEAYKYAAYDGLQRLAARSGRAGLPDAPRN